MNRLIAHRGAEVVDREALRALPLPPATDTHKPIPHVEVVDRLTETLGFRQIGIIREEYAVTPDGMRMFGVLDLTASFEGARFSLGVRNANDKAFRLALTVGYRVFVCDNLAFRGDFTPVLAKHTKRFDLCGALSVGVDQMMRHFGPLAAQVGQWREAQLTETEARTIIYAAFIEDAVAAPKHLARIVHEQYFHPGHPEFEGRTLWSLANAFTTAFKELQPIARFKATASLGDFLGRRDAGSLRALAPACAIPA